LRSTPRKFKIKGKALAAYKNENHSVKKPANSIEINGKRYDAQTGQPLMAAHTAAGGVVDGIKHQKHTKSSSQVALKGAVVATHKQTMPIVPLSTTKLMDMKAPKRSPRNAAKAAASHSPQTAHTLMRHSVKKPTASLKRQHPAQSSTDKLLVKPDFAVGIKSSAQSVPAERQARAKQIAKSVSISRFSKNKSANRAATNHTYQPPKSAAAAVAQAPAITSRPLDIFEQALQRATSHEQPKVKQPKRSRHHQVFSKRIVSLAATSLSVLLLIAFIGFENRGNVILHVAAQKAGFSANMPGYRPSGFSLGRFNYSAGDVAINFHSNSDQRSFAIIEKPSDWDSATLRDNYVASADSQYQTTEVGGQTIYLYGNNAATWVNGGIWYQVQTNGALSDEQLTKLAGSL
jgi:hypothetical protein